MQYIHLGVDVMSGLAPRNENLTSTDCKMECKATTCCPFLVYCRQPVQDLLFNPSTRGHMPISERRLADNGNSRLANAVANARQ